MAAIPCQLTAVYDDATSTITISAVLPPPEAPPSVNPEDFYIMGSPTVSVDVRVSRKAPLSGTFAYYLKADADKVIHKYRVEWTPAGGWALPGTEVPYP